MSRKYPLKDTKILYGKASGRCSFANCRQKIVLEANDNDDVAQIGKIAHIRAHSKGGPRYDKGYPPEKVDTYDNWILVCGSCHDKIDTHENSYSVSDLLKIKEDHELWIDQQIENSLPNVTFIELEQVCHFLRNSPIESVYNYDKIEYEKKILKNHLSRDIDNQLRRGLQNAQQVREYIIHQDKIDLGFSNSLSKTFKDLYEASFSKGATADDIYYELFRFASPEGSDFLRLAAGLSVLSYLFEICEIFEK